MCRRITQCFVVPSCHRSGLRTVFRCQNRWRHDLPKLLGCIRYMKRSLIVPNILAHYSWRSQTKIDLGRKSERWYSLQRKLCTQQTVCFRKADAVQGQYYFVSGLRRKDQLILVDCHNTSSNRGRTQGLLAKGQASRAWEQEGDHSVTNTAGPRNQPQKWRGRI